MNILLIGGPGHITEAFLEKFNKEGDRIFILSGIEHKKLFYRHAFEQYSFSYESPSLKEIFESVNPDVTIYMGAYDTNYTWKKPQEDSVRFSAGLVNILMTFSVLKQGRFIFLSSDIIFESSHPVDIDENALPTGRSFKSLVVTQGEEICRQYQQKEDLDIVILRMDHLYSLPNKLSETTDECTNMCVQALKTGVIEASSNYEISMLFTSDAADFIYQVMLADKPKHHLYHLSSSVGITQMELAKLIQDAYGDQVQIKDNTIGDYYRLVLSNTRFADEFTCNIFNPPEKVVPKMVAHIKWTKRRFLKEEDDGGGIRGRLSQTFKNIFSALFPFFENMVCFIPFFMLNNRAVGSQYFAKLDFYLLYVLLFAIVHGQQQAAFSAVLAIAGYCFRQMYTRSGFEVMLDFNTYVWIAQLFIVGLAVGRLKDQIAAIHKEEKDEKEYLAGQVDDVSSINTSNVRIKNIYEEQIVNHNQSIGKIYEITSELEQYAPEEVMFYAAEVVARLLESKDVAIYTVANGDYARLFSSTSPRARVLGNTLKYSEKEEMTKDILERRVFVNRGLKDDYPLLASGIYEEDKLALIIMVWGISWERMNLALSNLLVVTGYLIQNAVLRANRYQKALEHERFIEGTKILEPEAFTSLVRAYTVAQRKGLTECSLIAILNHSENFLAESPKLSGCMRQSDYIGELAEGKLYALLANTDAAGAAFVLKRFQDLGYEAEIIEDASKI